MRQEWTISKIEQIVSRYTSFIEFRKNEPKAYDWISSRGLTKTMCAHLTPTRNTWSDESVKLEALKYNSRAEFQKKCKPAYAYAHRNNILDSVCAHMQPLKTHWTLDQVKLIALRYSKRNVFRKENIDAYTWARSNNVLDKICEHMTPAYESHTLESVKLAALKYNNVTDFYSNDQKKYGWAVKHGLVQEVCSHMKKSFTTWTHELAKEKALECTSISEFQLKFAGAYKYAVKNKILREILSHTELKSQWNYEQAVEAAKQCKYRDEFRKKFSGAYQWIRKSNSLKRFYEETGLLCTKIYTVGESGLMEWVKEYYPNAEKKKFFFVIDEKKVNREADIYIDELKIAIEYNGNYWHSEEGLVVGNRSLENPQKYHLQKRELFESIGIKLIQIQEDEWKNSPELVKSLLLSKFGKLQNKVFARKLNIKAVNKKTAQKFNEQNHLMGHYVAASYVGLYEKDRLVSIMGYRLEKKSGTLDISRFCSIQNTSVVGGLSKLLSYIKSNVKCKTIKYSIDLRYGSIENMQKMGFKLKNISLGFSWTDGDERFNRLRCRANMDERHLTQEEYAAELGWVKIYDAGQAHMYLDIT